MNKTLGHGNLVLIVAEAVLLIFCRNLIGVLVISNSLLNSSGIVTVLKINKALAIAYGYVIAVCSRGLSRCSCLSRASERWVVQSNS